MVAGFPHVSAAAGPLGSNCCQAEIKAGGAKWDRDQGGSWRERCVAVISLTPLSPGQQKKEWWSVNAIASYDCTGSATLACVSDGFASFEPAAARCQGRMVNHFEVVCTSLGGDWYWY